MKEPINQGKHNLMIHSEETEVPTYVPEGEVIPLGMVNGHREIKFTYDLDGATLCSV